MGLQAAAGRSSGRNPSAIKIKDGEARYTAKQVKEYLLCGDCEQKLGVYDNYTSVLAFKNGTLPARAAVGAILGSSGRVQVAKPGTLDSARLAYFACSVVWRGHIATTLPRCRLGPTTIGESFRAYLNGERAFPPKVLVTLSLLLDDDPTKAQLGQVITMPLSMRNRPNYSHEFALCGMYFAVRTGGGTVSARGLADVRRADDRAHSTSRVQRMVGSRPGERGVCRPQSADWKQRQDAVTTLRATACETPSCGSDPCPCEALQSTADRCSGHRRQRHGRRRAAAAPASCDIEAENGCTTLNEEPPTTSCKTGYPAMLCTIRPASHVGSMYGHK